MSSDASPIRNCYTLSPEESAALKAKVAGAEGEDRWWGSINSPGMSPDQWEFIFKENRYHCAYCRKDLTATVADLANSTVDHLVPQWVFEPRSLANRRRNLVPACSSCNSVKGPWVPPVKDEAWKSRRYFVRAARIFIEQARRAKFAAYEHLVGVGSRCVTIWPPEDDLAEDPNVAGTSPVTRGTVANQQIAS